MKFTLLMIVGLLVLLGGSAPLGADEPATPKVATVASGLDSPMSLAIQPGTGAIVIVESGAGRVVQLTPTGTVEIVSGLPTEPLEYAGAPRKLGPLAIEFVERNLLALACSAKTSGTAPLRFYNVPTPPTKVAADKPKVTGSLAAGDQKKATAVGDIFSLTVAGEGKLFLISSDPQHADRGWLGMVEIGDDQTATITPILGTGSEQPHALALSPRGECVTAEVGSEPSRHSLLKFYDPIAKKQLLRLDSGLRDISGLAYSPRTGWLYATAEGAKEGDAGGLFRLDRAMVDGKPGVKAVLVSKLDRPSGLRFAPNGVLYVTLLGSAEAGKEKSGSVVRLTGRL